MFNRVKKVLATVAALVAFMGLTGCISTPAGNADTETPEPVLPTVNAEVLQEGSHGSAPRIIRVDADCFLIVGQPSTPAMSPISCPER